MASTGTWNTESKTKVFLNFQASDGFFFLKRQCSEKYSYARFVMHWLVMATKFAIELHLETQGHGLLEKTLLLKAGLQIINDNYWWFSFSWLKKNLTTHPSLLFLFLCFSYLIFSKCLTFVDIYVSLPMFVWFLIFFFSIKFHTKVS